MFRKPYLHYRSPLFLALLLVAYEFAIYLSNDAYLPGLPQIALNFKTTAHLTQLTLTLWFLGGLAPQLFLGQLTEQIGRRPVLLVGAVLFIVASIACSLSTTIYMLLLWRFIQGSTTASMIIASYSTLHELLDREQAIRILAIMSSMTVLAPAFGPLLGSYLLTLASWRWIFVDIAVFTSVVFIGLLLVMPETANPHHAKQTAGFSTALQQYWRVLTSPQYMLLGMTALFLFAGMISWICGGPFLIIRDYHLSTHYFGIAQALIFGSFIAGNWLVKYLTKHFALPKLTLFGLSLAALGAIYSLITALALTAPLTHFIIGMMLLTFGSGLVNPILNRLSIEGSKEPMGARVAISSALFCLFGTLGSWLVSLFYQGTLQSLVIIISVMTVIGLGCYWRAPRAWQTVASQPSSKN